MNSNTGAIIVEQVLDAPIHVVWSAITSLDQMKQWFFSEIPAFEPVAGFQTKFKVDAGERSFTHIWKIEEVVTGNMIRYHWSYEEYEGVGHVTFELFEWEGQTLLKLTNEGLETFTADIPEFSRESCEGGWNYFIRQRLVEYLEGPTG